MGMFRALPCSYRFRRGWWCSRELFHDGPCALRPRWWNLVPRLRGF